MRDANSGVTGVTGVTGVNHTKITPTFTAAKPQFKRGVTVTVADIYGCVTPPTHSRVDVGGYVRGRSDRPSLPRADVLWLGSHQGPQPKQTKEA